MVPLTGKGNTQEVDGEPRMSTTVLKAFTVLDLLASKDESSLVDVSEKLGTSKSTALRYLTTFEKLGVVTRDDADRFYLGPKLIELAGAYLSNHSLRSVAMPLISELAEETRETVHLAVPSGNEVVYIGKVDSAHSIQMASRIGGRVPMYCTSLGKSILAHSPDHLEEIISEDLVPRTPHTVEAPEALREQLERVRNQGFAVDDEENELGVRCVGAPVFDYSGKVIGAISVSGPANRMTQEQCLRWGPLLRDTGLQVSRGMGYQR